METGRPLLREICSKCRVKAGIDRNHLAEKTLRQALYCGFPRFYTRAICALSSSQQFLPLLINGHCLPDQCLVWVTRLTVFCNLFECFLDADILYDPKSSGCD